LQKRINQHILGVKQHIVNKRQLKNAYNMLKNA